MHLLRNLARACLGLLKELLQEQPLPQSDADIRSTSPGVIIITTIATVLKQRDLWMDAEDLFRKHSLLL